MPCATNPLNFRRFAAGPRLKGPSLRPGSAPAHLEFERPIGDLEAKIEELSKLSETAGDGAFDSEIGALRARVETMRREAYGNLDAWQKTQVARHPERPHFSHYVAQLIEDFEELRGDRQFADDQAVVGGLGRFRGAPVVVIGHEKGHDTTTRIKHNLAWPRPEGYREAVQPVDTAERFNLPVLTFVDTAGAYPGVGGEAMNRPRPSRCSTGRCPTTAVQPGDLHHHRPRRIGRGHRPGRRQPGDAA